VTAEPPEGPPTRARAWAERTKTSAQGRLDRAQAWVGETQGRRLTFDVVVDLRERDRESFASVLGSAIALRLFLFGTASIVAIISLLNLILGSWDIESVVSSVGLTGGVATEIGRATESNTGRDLGLFLSTTLLMLLAGRSLTVVLAACSAGAWRLEARAAKASAQAILWVVALIAFVIVAAALLQRLRDSFGPAVATSSVLLNVAMLGGAWFFVTLALPKPTRDPGAMLPGAATFGILLTLVQWFMHYYLPVKVANASETMGSLGVTVASLGYLFLVGRLMAGCIVLNAVIWERFGSISEVVFRLPWLRRLPERFPKVARFFDLEVQQSPAEVQARRRRRRR
jgi:hypothetical protein